MPPFFGASITYHDEETTVAGSEGDERRGKREVVPSVIGLSGNKVRSPAMLPIDAGKLGSEMFVGLDLKPKKSIPILSNQE